MDFLMDQILFYTSEKYEEVYIHLNTKFDVKYQDLFSICASIGFKNNRRSPIETRGREFRSNYFNTSQRATIYSILLGDPELGKNIEQFDDNEFRRQARKRLEEYAEGGMEILISEVFGNRWDGNKLDPNYSEYEIDILGYIYSDAQAIPF
ncbi:hypothetical protein SAMN05216389_11543 [Oceanobacillus limi]|uniref:Uncharacterized protein n=1 Tax=Oceanobacillus limi TaxID=930131 RepID=A0A1I0FGK1_9BACI|nr:hypothetical protein [Oceanobacillus limi]SET57352.1 hypothetical protein SAMN05216389_11543 [Oceanobacillus limi]